MPAATRAAGVASVRTCGRAEVECSVIGTEVRTVVPSFSCHTVQVTVTLLTLGVGT